MQLVKFSPFSELQRMEWDFDKLWGDGWGFLPAIAEASALDMYEEDGQLVAKASLPAFSKDEVKVSADEGVLEISAEHKEKKEETDKRRYFLRESSRTYQRRVALPKGVQAEKAEAGFKDGVLKVTMPFTAQREVKRVEVK